MNKIKKDSKDYIGYEYKEITASGERASFYLDCYQSFGWMPDERMENGKSKFVLKRERKIMNKAELTRLQRHFEACMDEITALEHSRTTNATITALIVGLMGTAFMAGSVFAVIHIPPLVVLSVILALPGFLGWILPWFIYKKMVSRRSKLVTELVERKYDEIYEICEQGNQLLN
ncbi:MAG: hypothetical protein K2M15_05130 [Oscillospiraceae bacterium]|nr:hypothetical protein [Oscillospiraceae bacterium]MDE7172502.1 hypothetical protein [Oscillospiraceae bacterium]